MKRLPALTALLLLAGILNVPAEPVELNGLACFFGQKYALFGLGTSGLLLAEGETHAGIKLLAVDAAAGRVQIENHGERQSLRLSSAGGSFSVSMAVSAGNGKFFSLPGANPSAPAISPEELEQQYQAMAGNPGWGTIPPLNSPVKSAQNNATTASAAAANGNTATTAAGNSANAAATSGATSGNAAAGSAVAVGNAAAGTEVGNNNNSSVGQTLASATTAAGTTTSATALTSQEWYIEASRMEEERIISAPDVLAGNSEPWPLTPLTPPGTLAALIGRGVMFSNHMPGNFVVPGYVD